MHKLTWKLDGDAVAYYLDGVLIDRTIESGNTGTLQAIGRAITPTPTYTEAKAIWSARTECPKSLRFPPFEHPYTVHLTYTGTGCAMCGQPSESHVKGELS